MIPLAQLLRECLAATASDRPAEQVAALLRAALDPPARFAAAMPVFDEEEVLLHREARLTVVHVRLTPNVCFPPHEHRMPAVIALYRGAERSLRYTEDGERLRESGATDYAAGEVTLMDHAAIHAVQNRASTPSSGLHVYLGDLLATPRRIWHPETFVAVPYTDETYFAYARPADPARAFEPPAVCLAHSRAP